MEAGLQKLVVIVIVLTNQISARKRLLKLLLDAILFEEINKNWKEQNPLGYIFRSAFNQLTFTDRRNIISWFF
jgi:acetyl-CoA carboxylase beta subunit